MNSLKSNIGIFLNFISDSDDEKGDLKVKEKTKIAEKMIGCDLDKCFKGTIPYNPNNKNTLICDIVEPEKKVFKRIFYNNTNNNIGYIEVFQNPNLSFAYHVSNHISFLFESLDPKNQEIDENKCFGFRYYNSKNEYCTLLKIGNDDADEYKFLEKIEDNGNIFFNNELDCFEIVYEAIFSKYKNKNSDFNFILGECPLNEIQGFAHAIILKNNDNFRFHKPYSLNEMDIKDFTTNIKTESNKKILHIMPILFGGHISLLYFVDEGKRRAYILSDPSHYHSKRSKEISYIDEFIFPRKMRESMILLPQKKIQKFNSCSLWYFFQCLILINHDKKIQNLYEKPGDGIKSIINNTIYKECLNYYESLFGFEKPLIKIEPDIKNIDDDYLYFIREEGFRAVKNIAINKKAFLNQFVDVNIMIELLTEQDLSYLDGFGEIKIFQNHFEEFVDFLLLLNYNLNFLYLNWSKDDKSRSTRVIESAISRIKYLNETFLNNCLDYLNKFAKERRYLYNMDNSIVKYRERKAEKEKIIKLTDELNTEYEELKNEVEGKMKLYPPNVTSKILFPVIGILNNSK